MIRHNILNNATAAQQYITGVTRLKDPSISPWEGQPGLSLYDFFVFWHHRSMMLLTPPSQNVRNAAHSGPVFLPWHRYMLLMLEFFMRDTLGDDDFRLPYWDWAGDAELLNPSGSPVWGAELLGQFTGPAWEVRMEPNPIERNPRVVPGGRQLERTLGAFGRLPRRSEIRDLIRESLSYDLSPYDSSVGGLRNVLEGWVDRQGQPGANFHNVVHVWIGGDMSVSTSPNDPTFYLHHANVDRIWAAWRQQHPNVPYRPEQAESQEFLFHRIDDAMHTFFSHDFDVTPRMMLDESQWYQYDTFADLI